MVKMKMMNFESETPDLWYDAVAPDIPLTQGDIILDCPIIRWANSPVERFENETLESLLESLDALYEVAKADVIVMSQACDLEQNKIRDVILCPHISLEKYKEHWEKIREKQTGQKPNKKEWTKTCKDISNGYVWNLAMLNQRDVKDLSLTHRIVDFHNVYTLPRTFLESLLQVKSQSRLCLRPPYREHLSQAFARFFMRVGLPTGIKPVW